MTKLAAASGIVLYEEGPRIYISKRPALWTSTFLFVTGLLTFILFTNGVLQLFFLKEQGGSSKIGIILIPIAVFFAILFWRAWVYHKKNRAIPFNKLPTIAVFDFETNKLLDGGQHVLIPLDQAWLDRRMQITSSSPELVIRWNGGSLSLVKGNPFSGGVGIFEKILVSKGIRRRQ